MRSIGTSFLAACILVFAMVVVVHCVNWLVAKGTIWFIDSMFQLSLKFWKTYGVMWIGELISLAIIKKNGRI
jgi:hypothetical protein